MFVKKLVLVSSILGVLVLVVLFNTKEFGVCSIYCGSGIDKYQDIFIFFPILLFYSLLTFKMNDLVFTTWWKFARIAVPLILLITFIISLELHHSPGGWFNIDDAVDMALQFGLYTVFTIGSFIQIYRGYKKER